MYFLEYVNLKIKVHYQIKRYFILKMRRVE